MSQQQHDIEVEFLDGPYKGATRTGNNATWVCSCGRTKPLLGFSSSSEPPSEATLVICPDCDRRYQVVAPTDRAIPTVVRETK